MKDPWSFQNQTPHFIVSLLHHSEPMRDTLTLHESHCLRQGGVLNLLECEVLLLLSQLDLCI